MESLKSLFLGRGALGPLLDFIAEDSGRTSRLTGLWDNSKVVGARDFVDSGDGQKQYCEFFVMDKMFQIYSSWSIFFW